MNWYIKKFEELTVKELYEILRVRSEVFVVEQNCVYQDCDNKDKYAYHLFAIENKDIVAYLRILEKSVSYKEVSIGRVLSSEKHRRMGLGREAMLRAILFIKNSLNENKIRISAQEYAAPFYEGIGFEIASGYYLEDDITHVEMLLTEL